MSTHRHIDVICVVVLLLTLLLTVLFMNGESYGLQVIVDEDAEDYAGDIPFTENDKNGAWDSSGATRITLNGDGASVSGGGAYAFDGNVMITSAGKYVVSGTLDDGSIIVDTNNSAKVWIMLNGASLRCTDSACIDVEQADKVFLSLAEGTENSLITTGFSAEKQTAGVDGALFSRDDLTINGTGSLLVTAEAEHGIVCNDELVITGGSLAVTAAGDGLHANDGLRIMAAELNLTAGDDGISLTAPESELYFESGNLTVTATGDGINAENTVRILGGSISLTAEDDGISTSAGTAGILELTGGSVEIRATDKGISAEGEVAVNGGRLVIDSVDDGISAVGEIHVTDGDLTITTTDDGIHSDTAVAISGGTLQIPSCYEGIEAVHIDISGGDISIYPEDDGMNANGGSDLFGGMPGGFGGMPGGPGMRAPGMNGMGDDTESFPGNAPDGVMPDGNQRPEMPEGMESGSFPMPEGADLTGLPDGTSPESAQSGNQETPSSESGAEMNGTDPAVQAAEDSTAAGEEKSWIHISGGSITVINSMARDADGLDSNGDIIISGGVIRVSLTNSGSNNALDYGSESGGVMEISGGEVIACGSYAMAEGFDASSTQCSIMYNIKRGAAAGTRIALEDSEGNVIVSYEAPCSFSSVAISCPEMKIGESYIIVIGDSVEEITLEEVSASFGDAQSEGFGGPMNWGRMRFRPESEQDGLQDPAETDEAAA